jgi:hypothetical protein
MMSLLSTSNALAKEFSMHFSCMLFQCKCPVECNVVETNQKNPNAEPQYHASKPLLPHDVRESGDS